MTWFPGMHPRCFLCLDPLDSDTISEGTDLCLDCMRRENELTHLGEETDDNGSF